MKTHKQMPHLTVEKKNLKKKLKWKQKEDLKQLYRVNIKYTTNI